MTVAGWPSVSADGLQNGEYKDMQPQEVKKITLRCAMIEKRICLVWLLSGPVRLVVSVCFMTVSMALDVMSRR